MQQLGSESAEPEGFVFNVVDSGSSSTGNKRTGADWYSGARGRLVQIPVDFNLQPIDIARALTVPHIERIEELESRLDEVEQDRAQFHCPYCDARLSGVAYEDTEYHEITWESFECGYVTADGREHAPCPYGPNWPTLDEFDFVSKPEGSLWFCYASGKQSVHNVSIFLLSSGGRKKRQREKPKTLRPPKRKNEREPALPNERFTIDAF